jgi:hypothetical protein
VPSRRGEFGRSIAEAATPAMLPLDFAAERGLSGPPSELGDGIIVAHSIFVEEDHAPDLLCSKFVSNAFELSEF